MLNNRDDFARCLLSMADPLIPYFSEKKARLDLGKTGVYYDKRAISMEGISRLFWGFVPFFAGMGQSASGKSSEANNASGTGNASEIGMKERAAQWQQILTGALTEGCDPQGSEYWGDFSDKDQKFVEMAAIAYGMLFAREKLWQPLSENAKDNLAAYLYQINEYVLPECNWVLFAVLVNIALKSVGRKYSPQKLEAYLKLTESFYAGDGWYRDGDSDQKDYYISFAIHFYCLIYAKVMEQEDTARCALFKERAVLFAKQFIYWFDDSGEALPFGRSLTYRFAQVSFFCACVIAGIEPFTLGQMKGLICRHMENWLKKDIFDRDHILTIGYGYPNLIMAEAYNAPGSPYWSFKTFAILMLPKEHPFWSTAVEEFPRLTPLSSQPFADKLMYHHGSHATAYPVGIFSPAGHGQSIAKYGKFAYDTCFGFHVAKSNYSVYENAPDSMLAFEIGGDCHVRRISIDSAIHGTDTWSKWSPYPGITVETIIEPDADGHTRRHKITSEVECTAYDCGFAVACRDEDGMRSEAKDNRAAAENAFSKCAVKSLNGGLGIVLGTSPNTNVLYQKTVLPAVKYTIPKGTIEITTRVDCEKF